MVDGLSYGDEKRFLLVLTAVSSTATTGLGNNSVGHLFNQFSLHQVSVGLALWAVGWLLAALTTSQCTNWRAGGYFVQMAVITTTWRH